MGKLIKMRDEKLKIYKRGLFTISLLAIITALLFIRSTAKADDINIIVKEINYNNSTITLQTNQSDTAIYFSDSSKKWKVIPGQIDSNGMISMDISWVPDTLNYNLYFKGNISTNIINIIIPKKETRFKASFNTLKGTVLFSNVGDRSIEWRKIGSTSWHTVNQDTLATELWAYFSNGAQLCYRLAPVNGTGISDPGLRGSNEVTVSIPKKSAAPSITVNGSKFSIALNKGIAYRKLISDGVYSDWITINSNTNLLLSNIAPEVIYNIEAGVNKSAVFQFRSNASTSKQVSEITTLTIPVQKAAPDLTGCGISLSYTSASTLSIIVKTANTSSLFEYTIVPKGKVLNYQTATWKDIASSSAVSITSKSAPEGSHIFVRKKSMEASDTRSFSLASVETDISGAEGIVYPPAVQTTQLTTLVSTAGVCRSSVASSYLTFYLYSATSTTVTSIDIYDVNGNKRGSVTFSSAVARNSGSSGLNDQYIITTKITSTDSINTITDEALFAYITFSNQEVIKSTPTTGLMLYLYPASIINNPSDSGYTNNFKRIYMSKDENDAFFFKFRLDFGTEYLIDPTGTNKYTSEATAISSIKYNDYTLIKDTDYTVAYSSYINNDNMTVATATVTVNVSSIEKSVQIKNYDQAIPLAISLNNGETFNNNICITMLRTAVIDNIPIAWSVTEGTLAEKTSSTVTNADGSTSSSSQDVVTYTISLTLFSDTYDVSVSNVTWGGISIFKSATVSKGKATIYLSNAKINKLETDSSKTNNIVITLSNGYVISTGCKLTIINAN